MQTDRLTLSQFQQLVTNAINKEFGLKNVWVQAEFSDLRVAGGHCYMELVEKDASGTTRAKIRAIIWSGTLAALRRKFFDATGRDIASGMKVLVRGSASHHSIYGLSFTISDIDPTYTLGDMERVRREILERLTREGVIGRNRQLPLSPALQRIAVISAEGAAGYGDFINQLAYNPDGFAMYTMLFPAVMQGERTAPTVMAALDRVEMTRDMWDAVAIVRGGGSTTDLNGFDNYELARRVALFPIPVIVGIGHERDRTVLDEIACVRCKTPTAVASFIIDSMRGAWEDLTDHMNHIIAYGNNALRGEHLWLTNLSQKIPALARNFILQEKMKLAGLSQSVPSLVQGRVMRQRLALGEYASRLGSNVAGRIAAARGSLDRAALRVENSAAAITRNETQRLRRLDDMLRLLSPDNTLRRGYSITRVDGHAVTDPAGVPPGSVIETTLAGGKIVSVSRPDIDNKSENI